MRYLHVAGTNGKGSVAAMAESAIRCSGIRTGLFTSPHLSEYTERIRVDGRQIAKDELAKITGRLSVAAADITTYGIDPPTEFELCTALCLDYFGASGVKLAVMEVGLGGRYDSTNVIEPDVSVITHISYDHMERLGRSLSEIAFDKCGILKKGVPAVIARQEPEALGMIRREASARGCTLWLAGEDYSYYLTNLDLQGSTVEYHGRNLEGEFRTRLVGVHQADNASVALSALDALMEAGWNISGEDVAEGLATALHPGRFEVIEGSPLVILDGAHNPDGASALSSTMKAVMQGMKPVAVMGFSADKPYGKMIELLSGQISALFGTGIAHARSGAIKPSAIKEAGESYGIDSFAVEDHVECLAQAARLAVSRGVPLVVCGSLYLIGEIRGMLMQGRKPDGK